MEYRLWEKNTPYFDSSIPQPEPALIPYLVEGNEKRGAVIIFPGGAYVGRCEDREGSFVAEELNKRGFHAFVCTYRVTPYHHPVELGDALRAVRYLRYHADKFNILPDKIAVMGFSAGGHLAITACEHFDYGRDDGDEIDKMSSRPDAGVFCYAVSSLRDPLADLRTRTSLLGDKRQPELEKELSGDCSVRADMPPAFILHGFEDGAVHMQGSIELMRAIKSVGVPVELHVFSKGAHGFGAARELPLVAQWNDLVATWLTGLGF